MAGHSPYIMPDGRTLAAVLRAEGAAHESKNKQKKGKRTSRAKDELWRQLQHSKFNCLSAQELAEVTAMERVGHRRRQQWINDKLLRDLAGPMSMADMESQFKPVPFGFAQPPSAFTLASAPEAAAVWDHFRNIDSDKEARVLQAWAAHSRAVHQQRQHPVPSGALNTQDCSSSGAAHASVAAATAAALAQWSRVGWRARAALKRASLQAVRSLEHQAVQLLEQDDPDAQVLLDLPDPFARLLMHGLAQFHGLVSTTCNTDNGKAVLLQCPQQQGSHQQAQQQQQQQQVPGFLQVSPQSGLQHAGTGVYMQAAAAAGAVPADDAVAGAAGAAVGEEEGWLPPPIMCSDIVGALQEMGGALDHHALQAHVDRAHA